MPRRPDPSDLTAVQWALLAPLLPAAKPGGRPRGVDLRTGAAWRYLPHDFPPHETVSTYSSVGRPDGTWAHLHPTLRERVRRRAGRDATPGAGIVDSQSVKPTNRGGVSGYGAGKKVTGRKRHLVVETLGLLLAVVAHSAALQDRDGAKLVLAKHARGGCARLQLRWADGGYAGQLVAWVW